MIPGRFRLVIVIPLISAASVYLAAQAPGGGRGGGAGRGATANAPPPFITPGAKAAKMQVDDAAADRGGIVYNAECVNCHGPKSRGTAKGADLIRSELLMHDRYGDLLLPYLQKGHPTLSGKPGASLAKDQITELTHFLKQRLNETLNRAGPGSSGNPAPNIVTGDPKAGEAWFNNSANKCTTCHQPTGDLKGIATRLAAIDLQQRFLFPGPGGRGGRGGRGGAAGASGGPVAAAPAVSTRGQVTVTVTPPAGAPVTGVPVVNDDFNVSVRTPDGLVNTWTRTPALKVVINDPLVFHHALLGRITDKEMHDVVAYLETLK